MSKLYESIPKELKDAVVAFVKRGLSYREISRMTGVSHGSISNIIKQHRNAKDSCPENAEEDLLRTLGKKKEEESPTCSDANTVTHFEDGGFDNITNAELIGLLIKRYEIKNLSELARVLGVSQAYIWKVQSKQKQKDFLAHYTLFNG